MPCLQAIPFSSTFVSSFFKMKKILTTVVLTCHFILGNPSLTPISAQAAGDDKPGKASWTAVDPSGFYNVTTFSIDFFKGPLINGIQTIAGYRMNPFIAVGGGVGLERYVNMNLYDTLTANLSQVPVFAEVRYTILDSKITPVIALQGGYKFLTNRTSSQVTSWDVEGYPPSYTHYDEYDYYDEGGFCFTIEGGVKARMYKRFALYLSASYSVWSVSGDHYKWTYVHLVAPGGPEIIKTSHTIYPTTAYIHMLLFRLGVSF